MDGACILEATYPNANEAGTPRTGRLTTDRSSARKYMCLRSQSECVTYSGRRWWSRRGLRMVSIAPLQHQRSKHTYGQQHEANCELRVLADGRGEGRGSSSLPDV